MSWNTHTSPHRAPWPGRGPYAYSYTFREPVGLSWLESSIPAQLLPALDGGWMAAQWDADYETWTVWTNEERVA